MPLRHGRGRGRRSSDAEAAGFPPRPRSTDLTTSPHSSAICHRAWIDEQFAKPVATQIPYLDWVNGIPDNYVTDDTAPKRGSTLGTPDPSRGMARSRRP